MSQVIIATRDAVVKAFNDAGLTPVLTAIPIYDLAFSLADLAGGRVVVMPQTKEPQLSSRGPGGAQKNDVKIDLAVQYKYSTPIDAEIDPYMKLVEAAADKFLGATLTAADGTFTATCLEISFPDGAFFPPHIRENVFTSTLRLHFRIYA